MLNAANLKYVRSSSKITAVHNRCGLVCHASLSAGLARRRRPEVKDRAESSRLRLFLDSANLTQWELNMSTGMFYGGCTAAGYNMPVMNRCYLDSDSCCQLQAMYP